MSTPPPADVFWNLFPRVIPTVADREAILAFHRRLPGYAPSPVVSLDALARDLDVGEIIAKVETTRLGLPAFKILGASWAIFRELRRRFPGIPEDASLDDLRAAIGPSRRLIFVAATDGNHGRAVAHMARLLGQRSHILVPAGMASARIKAIQAEGEALVEIVNGTYDDAIAASAAYADDIHVVISDTAWEGYEDVPRDVIDGYSTMFAELDGQIRRDPTHVFVQMGVGALGAAAILGAKPWQAKIVSVEPADAACVLASLREKRMTEVPGPHRSIMAGLNCGLPSQVAWPLLRTGVDLAVAVEDDAARDAMRALAEAGVVAGETGAAGLAGLLSLAAAPDWAQTRQRLDLDERSRVLVVITEGATDPEAWEAVTGRRLAEGSAS